MLGFLSILFDRGWKFNAHLCAPLGASEDHKATTEMHADFRTKHVDAQRCKVAWLDWEWDSLEAIAT